jgi:hypothetical protein
MTVGMKLRGEVIAQHADLSHHDICKQLDFEFGDRPPSGYFPESWSEGFGVSNFVAAYLDNECRPLVQKMISTEKKKIPYLSPEKSPRRLNKAPIEGV